MTDTQREFEAKFPVPVGVTLFGKEYVWFGGNDHGKTCDSYNNMWKAFQAGLEANSKELQAIYDDMYRHKDIAQVAQKLFMLINEQAALAHSQQTTDMALLEKVQALPRYSFLLNSSGGVTKYADKSGAWIERYEVIKLIDKR